MMRPVPTLHFRWLRTYADYCSTDTLQQRIDDGDTGEELWVNVPIILDTSCDSPQV